MLFQPIIFGRNRSYVAVAAVLFSCSWLVLADDGGGRGDSSDGTPTATVTHNLLETIPEPLNAQQHDWNESSDGKGNNASTTPSSLPSTLTSSSSSSSSISFTAYDDVSWAITSTDLSKSKSFLGPSSRQEELYQQFMQECNTLTDGFCTAQEEGRLHMNQYQPRGMVNYTRDGFAKIRAPPKLFALLQEFWNWNRGRETTEPNDVTVYMNSWQVATSLLKTEESHFIGGGWNLSAAVWNAARDILGEWTGQTLAGSSVYGIRLYHNQSILTPHVDRLPLVSSAIINVAQDVEEDWVLEVFGHNGKATNVTMQPGDMVLYESHSVIHGRPYPLNGKYYANIFVHFEPMGDRDSTEPLPSSTQTVLPPYLLPNSTWAETRYKSDFPQGWTLLTNHVELVRKGDLYTLQYVVQRAGGRAMFHVESTTPTYQCELLNLAIYQHHWDVVLEFFLQQMEYNVNLVCNTEQTVLDRVQAELGRDAVDSDNAVMQYLSRQRALTFSQLLQQQNDSYFQDDACVLIRKALVEWQGGSIFRDADDEEDEEEADLSPWQEQKSHAAKDIMAFLFEVVGLDIDMVCGGNYSSSSVSYHNNDNHNHQTEATHYYKYGGIPKTPMDIRRGIYGSHQPRPDEEGKDYLEMTDLDPIWAYLHHNEAQTKQELDQENEDDDEDESEDNSQKADEQFNEMIYMSRCSVIQKAIQDRVLLDSRTRGAVNVLNFLVTSLRYNLNMICSVDHDDDDDDDDDEEQEEKEIIAKKVTPLDMAWEYYRHQEYFDGLHNDGDDSNDDGDEDDNDAVIRYLVSQGALSYSQLMGSGIHYDDDKELDTPMNDEL